MNITVVVGGFQNGKIFYKFHTYFILISTNWSPLQTFVDVV